MKRITFAENKNGMMIPMPWFIKAVRTQLKMNQTIFALECGVSSACCVSRWENGTNKPDPRSCRKIMDLYGRLSSSQHDMLWAKALGEEAKK